MEYLYQMSWSWPCCPLLCLELFLVVFCILHRCSSWCSFLQGRRLRTCCCGSNRPLPPFCPRHVWWHHWYLRIQFLCCCYSLAMFGLVVVSVAYGLFYSYIVYYYLVVDSCWLHHCFSHMDLKVGVLFYVVCSSKVLFVSSFFLCADFCWWEMLVL